MTEQAPTRGLSHFWAFLSMAHAYTVDYWTSIYRADRFGNSSWERALRYEGWIMGTLHAFEIDLTAQSGHQELVTRVVRRAFPDTLDDVRARLHRLRTA